MLEEVCFKPDFLVPVLIAGAVCWIVMTAIHRPLLGKVRRLDRPTYDRLTRGLDSSWVDRWWHVPSDAMIVVRLVPYVFRTNDHAVISRFRRMAYRILAIVFLASVAVAIVTVLWFVLCVAPHIEFQ